MELFQPVFAFLTMANKAPKSDKVKLSRPLQKAQRSRQLHFAPWQRRYALVCTLGPE
jgi:hypothetical protein